MRLIKIDTRLAQFCFPIEAANMLLAPEVWDISATGLQLLTEEAPIVNIDLRRVGLQNDSKTVFENCCRCQC